MGVTISTAAERRQRQAAPRVPGLRPAGRLRETALLGGALAVVLLGLGLLYSAVTRSFGETADGAGERRDPRPERPPRCRAARPPSRLSERAGGALLRRPPDLAPAAGGGRAQRRRARQDPGLRRGDREREPAARPVRAAGRRARGPDPGADSRPENRGCLRPAPHQLPDPRAQAAPRRPAAPGRSGPSSGSGRACSSPASSPSISSGGRGGSRATSCSCRRSCS